jgi:hypothetical protein
LTSIQPDSDEPLGEVVDMIPATPNADTDTDDDDDGDDEKFLEPIDEEEVSMLSVVYISEATSTKTPVVRIL